MNKPVLLPQRIVITGFFLFAIGLPISHVPAQFGIGLSFLGWLLEGLINRRWQVRWHVVFVPISAYLLWNILSASLSERPAHSLAAVLDNEWPILIMVLLYWTSESSQRLFHLTVAFLISSAFAMVYGVWQTVGGVEFYRNVQLDPIGWGFYRAVGFYGFYLTFAALAMTVFFLSTALLVELKSKKRWLFGATALVSFLAVVGTFARSIWLSFAAAIPLFAFTRGKRTGMIVTASLLALLLVGVLTVPALRFRAASVVDLSQNETRLNLWKTAIRISEDYPLTGVGEDNWDHVFERYRVEGYYDTIVHPHSDYLSVLVSSGYPGLVAFVAIWGITLTAGFRASRGIQDEKLRAITLGSTFAVFGFLVGSLFQNYYGTFINCLGWWFVTGLLFAAHAASDRRQEVRKPVGKGKEGEEAGAQINS
ncbi:MAG: O-antigen ligase family protein [Ignavibacteria bacterium]|nr:O-antigen ligase family protein [Ignavibacteria bacterium]